VDTGGTAAHTSEHPRSANPSGTPAIARALVRVADREDYLRLLIANGTRDALSGSAAQQDNRTRQPGANPHRGQELGASADINGLSIVGVHTDADEPGEKDPTVIEQILDLASNDQARKLLAVAIATLTSARTPEDLQTRTVLAALADQDTAQDLELGFEGIATARRGIASRFRGPHRA
jgi:hypothetical protein